MAESPLSEARPDALEDLLSLDPYNYTEAEVTKIVEILRSRRHQWLSAEGSKAPKGAKAPKPAALPKVSGANLAGSIDELDL